MLDRMKIQTRGALLMTLYFGFYAGVQGSAQGQARKFQFEKFPTKVYHGRFHTPKGLRKIDGEWLNEAGKAAEPPQVTFAGEYYLTAHSCGTACRYYQLSNLRLGAEIKEVTMFDAGEPWPVTRDGHPYLTILYHQPDSRLLIAEYHLDFDNPNKDETCRQRYYILANGKLKAISKTFSFCTEDSDR